GNVPGGAHDVKNATVMFISPAANNYLLSTSDLSAKGAGTNLSADPNLAFSTDIANNTRTAPWDIGASMASGATSIYRSVGPSNISALASGGSNALTIANGLATFGSALPNIVGVGDALQYASTGSTINSIVFIHQRLSKTQYEVRTATGAAPTACTAEQTWNVYRAYTSVASSITGSGAENSGIAVAVRTFDNGFNGNNNLVSSNTQWNIAVYGDAPDSYSGAQLIFGGWTTSATNNLRIYAP